MDQNIFSEYKTKKSIFLDKTTLTTSFVPGKISHRADEIKQISSTIAPLINNYKPNNIFIYGTCGTGKTICARFVLNHLVEATKNVKGVYVNCKMKRVADTEYRLFACLLKELGVYVPDTGLPTEVLYTKFFEVVNELKTNIVLVLDEIDTIVKKIGDEFLYNLTRASDELKNSTITLIGITNDTSFMDSLTPRVKSTLSQEEVIFKPYNALQLHNILSERCSMGFVEGVIGEGVIDKCAAIAAQEHGDARRALDLIRVAGELAERTGSSKVTEQHIDAAQEKLDMDKINETVRAQPIHSQAVLYSIINSGKKTKTQWQDSRVLTGDVYNGYMLICHHNGMNPLTQRRISDLIGELDMLGIINAKVISKGRHGRTREINIHLSGNTLVKVKNLLVENFGVFDGN